MTDPLSVVVGGLAIGQGALQFLSYVRSVAGTKVISAYFKWDGTRLEGSDKIEIDKHSDQPDATVWWYSVKPQKDYVFVRIPVVESGTHELLGQVNDEPNPDYRYWQWVPQGPQGVIADGGTQPVNVKVGFIVVGYRPKALIKHFSSSA